MILAQEIGFENIKLSKRLSKIEQRNGYQLTFEDGTFAHADAVIGADGIKSVVRHQILNIGKLRSAKQKCWRGVSEFDWAAKYNHQAYEAWGKADALASWELMTGKFIGMRWLMRIWLKTDHLAELLPSLIQKFPEWFPKLPRKKYLSTILLI